MAGYQGGADQTVIAAAKAAYTIPEGYHASVWDYKEYVEGIANLAKFVVGKVGAANERMSTISGIEEGINTEFWNANNTEYFTDLKGRMAEASRKMKMGIPFTKEYKENERIWSNGMASLKKIKDDEATLEEIVKTIKSTTGAERSLWNDPMIASLMAEIQGDTGMFDQSVRFTDDGIMVVDPSGKYREIPLSELPNIAAKTDGRATHDFATSQVNSAIGIKEKGGWNDWNRSIVKQNISGHLDAQTRNGLGSAAFDYEFLTKDGSISFADHLVKTSGDLQKMYEIWEAEHPGEYSTDEIKNMKSMLAKNLWHNDSQMKDEYLNWVMEEVVDFHVGGARITKSGDGGGDDFEDDYQDDNLPDNEIQLTEEEVEGFNFDKIIAKSGTWKHHKGGKKVLSDQILDYRSEKFVAATLEREYGDLGFSFADSGWDEITVSFGSWDNLQTYTFETNFVGGGGLKEKASGEGLIEWMNKMMRIKKFEGEDWINPNK